MPTTLHSLPLTQSHYHTNVGFADSSIQSQANHEVEKETIRAIMMIKVAGQSTSQVIKKLRGIPELATLHTTNGAWDLVAEIQTTSLGDFDRVLHRVREVDGILNSETSLLLSSL